MDMGQYYITQACPDSHQKMNLEKNSLNKRKLLLQLSWMHRECSTLCIGSSVCCQCVCVSMEPATNEWNVSTAKVLIGRNHIVA